jgi:thiamine biosynthesis lipoprotein
MYFLKPILLISLSGLFLTGCFFSNEKKSKIQEIRGEIFGSYYIVKYRGELNPSIFTQELNVFFKKFNDEFSTYQSDSLISRFNQLPDNQKIKTSQRFIQMLEFSQELFTHTQGAFDPTLGPVIKLWGFGGGEKRGAPSEALLRKVRQKVGFRHIKWDEISLEAWKLRDGVELDLNAYAPGWAADLIGEMLDLHQIENYMVDISGEIIIKGEKAPGREWIIGIETPSKTYAQGVQMALKLKDQAIATSGNYRQFFDDNGERRSHIIDPRTGKPVVHNITSASVIGATAAEADAWSTAIMVLGQEGIDLAEKNGIKVYLLEAIKPGEFKPIISPSMKTFIQQAHL